MVTYNTTVTAFAFRRCRRRSLEMTQRVKSASGSALASPCKNVRIERSRLRKARHSCGCDHLGSLRRRVPQEGNQATDFGGQNPRRKALIRLLNAWEIRYLSKTTSLQVLERLFRPYLMFPCPNRLGLHKMPAMVMQSALRAGWWRPYSCTWPPTTGHKCTRAVQIRWPPAPGRRHTGTVHPHGAALVPSSSFLAARARTKLLPPVPDACAQHGQAPYFDYDCSNKHGW